MGHPDRCPACRDEGVPSRQDLFGRLLDADVTEALLERAADPEPYRFTPEYFLEQENFWNLESLSDGEVPERVRYRIADRG